MERYSGVLSGDFKLLWTGDSILPDPPALFEPGHPHCSMLASPLYAGHRSPDVRNCAPGYEHPEP